MVNLSGGKKNLSARKFGNLQKNCNFFLSFFSWILPKLPDFSFRLFFYQRSLFWLPIWKKLRKKFYQALLKNTKFVKHGIKKGGQGAETEERRERSKQTFSRQSCLNPLRRSVPPSRCRPALRLRRWRRHLLALSPRRVGRYAKLKKNRQRGRRYIFSSLQKLRNKYRVLWG